MGKKIGAVRVSDFGLIRPKSDTLTAPIFSGKIGAVRVVFLAKIGHPHRTYLSKSDGLGYRPSKLKKS